MGYEGVSSEGAGVVAVATDACRHWCMGSSLRHLRSGCRDGNRGGIREGIGATVMVSQFPSLRGSSYSQFRSWMIQWQSSGFVML